MTPSQVTLNPYEILGVSATASKAEITKAVAIAMKRKQYPVKAIAEAQKCLLDPKRRLLSDYLQPILPSVQRLKRQDYSLLKTDPPSFSILSEFDRLETAKMQPFAIVNPLTQPPDSGYKPGGDREVLSPQSILSKVDCNSQPPSVPESPKKSAIAIWSFDIIRVVGAILILSGFFHLTGSSGAMETSRNTAVSQQIQTSPSTVESRSESPVRERIQTSPSNIESRSEYTPKPRRKIRIKRSPSTPEPSSVRRTYRFPLSVCGDSNARGLQTWYPVYVDYSESRLQFIRDRYCGDAYKKLRETGEVSIQVASFNSRRDAEQFAELMQQKIGSGEVGDPTQL